MLDTENSTLNLKGLESVSFKVSGTVVNKQLNEKINFLLLPGI